MTTDPVVVVHFQLTESEAVGELRRRMIRLPPVYLLGLSGLTLIGLSLAGLSNYPGAGPLLGSVGSGTWTLLLILGAIALSLSWRLVISVPSRAWKSSPEIQGPLSIAFFETGVGTRSILGESHLFWAAYPRTIETRGNYLLQRLSRPSYTLVPKRAFSSAFDEVAFRDLVMRHTDAHLRSE